MLKNPINVLVVDDSPVALQYLVHLLESDPQIRVIGTAADGHEAIEFVARTRPDVVLMDIHMPRLDGFEATRSIMQTTPVPIVICSGTTDPKEVATTFRTLEAGALAFVEKPVGMEHADYESSTKHLLQTVKLMSEVKVVRRWSTLRVNPAAVAGAGGEKSALANVVAIGASTGGPPVLQTILSSLPKDFPAPLLIVQHIAHGFLSGLVEWLNQTTGWRVHIATHGIRPLPGHAYFAPDDFHMGLTATGQIFLSREEPENGLRPAVSFLFRTVSAACGGLAVGVLLSGMGRDGATELKLLRDAGAETIAQDRESSVVHGMPGEAIKLGGASHVLPAEKIADTLIRLVNRRPF
jgi:two-component system chemotaxis response regulator CheB